MKIIEEKGVFEASHNSDTTEGRGHKVVIGYFRYGGDAEKAARGTDVMGNNGKVERVDLRFIEFDSFEEFQAQREAVERAQAIQKLKPLERQLLGLS